MSYDYQSLLGLSSITADSINLESLVCKAFQLLNNGAALNYVLTSDSSGNATWQQSSVTLSGDVSGPSLTNVVGSVGGSTSALVHSAELLANAATNLNTVNAIVRRDGSGNFSAGTITANLTGNCSGSSSTFTSSLVGDVTGTRGATVVSLINGAAANQTVTLTGSQTLTNKILTGISNTIDANVLRNGSTYAVALSGVAPTSNQVLTYNGTNAVWAAVPAVTTVTMAGDITSASNTSVVSLVGGSTSALVHSAELLANAATSGNTINTIVKRSAAGDIAIQNLVLWSKLTNSGGTTIFDTATNILTVSKLKTTSGNVSFDVQSASNNTCLGEFAGNTSANIKNVCIGYSAGFNNATAGENVFCGMQSGLTLTGGGQCVFVGNFADTNAATSSNRIAIGYGAIVTGDNTMQLGNSSLTSVKTNGNFSALGSISGLSLGCTNTMSSSNVVTSGITCNSITSSGSSITAARDIYFGSNIAISGTWGGPFSASQFSISQRKSAGNIGVISASSIASTVVTASSIALFSGIIDSSIRPSNPVGCPINISVNGVAAHGRLDITTGGSIYMSLYPNINFTIGTSVYWDAWTISYVI